MLWIRRPYFFEIMYPKIIILGLNIKADNHLVSNIMSIIKMWKIFFSSKYQMFFFIQKKLLFLRKNILSNKWFFSLMTWKWVNTNEKYYVFPLKFSVFHMKYENLSYKLIEIFLSLLIDFQFNIKYVFFCYYLMCDSNNHIIIISINFRDFSSLIVFEISSDDWLIY